MAAPSQPRALLCALLALACEGRLDDAVGLAQSSLRVSGPAPADALQGAGGRAPAPPGAAERPAEVQQDEALGPWAQKLRQRGYASWSDWNAHKDSNKKSRATGFSANRDTDEAAAAVASLAWPAREKMPKPALITMLNRGRLGNRLFEWAAMLSIAREAGARVAARADGRYTPSSTPQIAGLGRLIWSSEDFEWLNTQPDKCHMWDSDSPLTLDYGLGNLSDQTPIGELKGTVQVRTAQRPHRRMNWARLWADAILTTPTPSPCSVVELDGFWQRPEFFVDHLDWLRPTFWNSEVAGKAKEIMDGWLRQTAPVGAVVGIHLRLGDYIEMGRNLNMGYYKNGLLEVKRHRSVDELTCVIFSDDIRLASNVSLELEACTRRLPVYPCAELGKGYHCQHSERVVNDKVSFYMMGQLPNIIIADSSYSFWAAILAPNKPMVIAPRVVEPAGLARHGDYAYLSSPLYGWWSVNASVGNHTSKAVQRAFQDKLRLDQAPAPPRWQDAGIRLQMEQEKDYAAQVRLSEWAA